MSSLAIVDGFLSPARAVGGNGGAAPAEVVAVALHHQPLGGGSCGELEVELGNLRAPVGYHRRRLQYPLHLLPRLFHIDEVSVWDPTSLPLERVGEACFFQSLPSEQEAPVPPWLRATVMSSNDLTPFGSRWERVNLYKQHRQRQMEATNSLRRPLGDITNVDILPREGPAMGCAPQPSSGLFIREATIPSPSTIELPKGSLDAITSDPQPSSGLVIHEATIPYAGTINLPKGSPGPL